MFYAGANMVTRGHAFRTCDWERATGMVDSFMSTYDLHGAKDLQATKG
jgi:4-hydroxyphenylacetate 3-monooxygenase